MQTEKPTITSQSIPEVKVNKAAIGTILTIGILLFLWVVAGFIAFVMSLVCFGRSGSTSEHVIGLLLAFFLGPFYWIYFFVSKSYCKT